VLGANDRMRIAVAGVNSRGKSHISGLGRLPNVEIAYVVDPEAGALAKGLKEAEKINKGGKMNCKAVADIRVALDDPDIDQFHKNFVHYNWHWFWATGNGDLNNQGTHQLDVARWAIDDEQTHPVRAMALGGRFQWNDQGETPNTMFGIAQFPNGQYSFFNVRNVNYKSFEVPEADKV